ncbi:RING-type domain-containing protein, partial [Haematococcus lacustris]
MTQLKQQEADELRQRYDEESARAVSLGVQLEDMAARAMKAEAAASRLQAVQDQLTALQAEHAKLKYTASISASSMASTQEQLQSLQQVAEAADFKAAAAQKEAEAWRGSEATCRSECARLRGEVSRSQAGTRAALASLKETQSALSKSQAATQAAEATGAELATRLAGREDEIARLKGTIRALEDSLHEAQSSSRATEVALATSRSQTNVVQGQLHSVTRSLELTLEGRQQLEGQLEGLGRELQAVKAVLMKGLEASEGLTRLQVQLASNKATLTDTRRQLQQAEADHAVALGAERGRTHRAEQQAAELAAQAAQTRHKAAAFLQHTITRLERSFEALAALQAAVGRGLGLLLERQEHSLGGLIYRLQVWDAQWLEVQEQVGQMAAKTQQLAALVAKHSTKQTSTEQADAASLEKLRSQVAKQRQEASHVDALAALRTAADERVEAERLRLSSRLRGIESELNTLKMTQQVETALSQRSELEREVQQLRAAMLQAEHTQLAQLNLRHAGEVEALQRQVQDLKKALGSVNSRVVLVWEAHQQLLGDMAVVAAHLASMGWSVRQGEP